MKNFLDEQVQLINTPAFIASDPVQFPHRYKRLQDIEIVSFIVATIAWGRREMILRDAERMLSVMGESPYNYVMNEDYKNLGSKNVHRTFFEDDLAYLLRGFHKIYTENKSIECLLEKHNVHNAWQIAAVLQNELQAANNGKTNARNCISLHFEKSALKRLNMALRWLVRNDGIVDLGVWKVLKPSELYIPLDVHVGNTARKLGILKRKSNDRKAVEELTAVLRDFCPEDPVKYDFALFGIGINEKNI
jgi:TIGR02757 family protein